MDYRLNSVGGDQCFSCRLAAGHKGGLPGTIVGPTLFSSPINDLDDWTDVTLTKSVMTPSWVVRWTCQKRETSYRETWTGWRAGEQQLYDA